MTSYFSIRRFARIISRKCCLLLGPRLAAGALVHIEAPAAPALPPGWEIWRNGRAGAVTHQLLKWAGHDA